MASTSINVIGDNGGDDGALAKYMRTFKEQSLYRDYEFVPMASEAQVPAGQGIYMTIPYFQQTGSGTRSTGVRGATFGDRANALSPVTSGEINPLLGATTPDQSNFRSSSVDAVDRKQAYF